MLAKNDCILYTIKITAICIAFSLLILSLSLWFFLLSGERKVQFAYLPMRADIYVLDAGHGGRDGGAVSANGITEKELNLAVATAMRDYLILCGAETVMTRVDDRLVCDEEDPALKGIVKMTDLKNRLKIAQNYPDARFVSLHMNKFPVEKYSGLQVYFSQNHEESKPLAEEIQERIRLVLQPNNKRKVKAAGSNIYLLDRLQMPAILIECGFLSNITESEKLAKKEYQTQMSVLIADCLLAN